MRITQAEMKIRRDNMIRVAYQLFKEHGIDTISLEKIAVTAGVSLKSVSRYFSSKTQLVEETHAILWKEIVSCILAGNEEARSKAANGLEELEIILWGFETLYQNHSDYIMFFYDYRSYLIRNRIKLSDVELDRILTAVRPYFLHALERGQADNSIDRSEPSSEQFLLIWAVVRYYVEHLCDPFSALYGRKPLGVPISQADGKGSENGESIKRLGLLQRENLLEVCHEKYTHQNFAHHDANSHCITVGCRGFGNCVELLQHERLATGKHGGNGEDFCAARGTRIGSLLQRSV